MNVLSIYIVYSVILYYFIVSERGDNTVPQL